jgi:hypothetical protein
MGGTTTATIGTTMRQNEGNRRHDDAHNGKGQHGDMRHDDGDRRQHGDKRHNDGNRRQHGKGKGQQGDRRYNDGDGRHDEAAR